MKRGSGQNDGLKGWHERGRGGEWQLKRGGGEIIG